MNPTKYHLRVGDLLHNPKNGAFGLITKVTRYYFHFFLMSKSLDEKEDRMQVMEDKARRETVYESIDAEVILPYYGTSKRRRKRKIYVDISKEL